MNSSIELSKEKAGLNKKESKDILKKLKSDYFLLILFNNLLKRKLLDIIKYNKNIKNRINININDYKEYSEKCSSIEIEIVPDISKYKRFDHKFYFINANKEKYYHIYFNNNKKEVKRCYINENEKIKIIKVIIDNPDDSLSGLFYRCKWNKSINFKKFRRNDITNMCNMFCKCKSLEELNLSNINTNNVTDMEYMFYRCSSLKELNLSKFNTNNVTKMEGMFYKCSCKFQNKIRAQYKNIKEEAFNTN